MVRDWERIAISTIYGPPDLPVRTPIPVGVLYMGFTSLAMYRAAQAADRQHGSPVAAAEAADRQHGSPVAAIARAAHDVLAEYVPTQVDLAGAIAATGEPCCRSAASAAATGEPCCRSAAWAARYIASEVNPI